MEESEILTAIKVAVEAAGYRRLKEKQIEAIVNLVKGNNIFAVPAIATNWLWQKFMLYLSTESV